MATVSLRLLGSSAVALMTLLVPSAAFADDPQADAKAKVAAGAPAGEVAKAEPDPNAWMTAPATRRSGFMVGAATGFGLGSIVGFPNDVKKIGYAPYYTATGARPTTMLEVWLGGALADWINFGLGFTSSMVLATGDNKARSGGGLFHIELFPLFYVSDRLRDLGIVLDVGAGVATITSPKDQKLVDSSAASLIGGGVIWEPLKVWRFRGGPFLMGNYMWSDTARRPAIFMGFRMNLYSGPSAPPAKAANAGS
ncbi:Hypothetical protein A7982_10072 [Minicystis rosea]|nr:Hypothetical protein A7982_10072 [Minicystis rosea]